MAQLQATGVTGSLITTGAVGVSTTAAPGTFNVLGTSYFSDDIYLRDGAVAAGDVLVRIYDSSDDGVIDVYRNNSVVNRIHGNGPSYITAGNLGINTTIPAYTLQVNGNFNATNPMINSEGTSNDQSVMQWRYGTSDAYRLRLKQTVTSGVVRWNFSQTNNSTDYNDVLVLDRGNVGIGNASPSRKLTVSNPVNGDIALFTNTNDADLLINLTSGVTLLTPTTGILAFGTSSTEHMRIISTGKVGIGTTAPGGLLGLGVQTSVQSTSGITLGVNDGSIEFVHSTFGSGFGSKLYFVDSGSGVTSLRIAGRGNSISFSDLITIIVSDTPTTRGNVGIGTITPAKKLDVNGDVRLRVDATGLGPSIILNNGTEVAGNYSQIAFGGTQFATTYLKGAIAYVTRTETNGRGDFYFLQEPNNNGNNAGLGNAVMVVTNLGNVGIGTTSPSSKFEVYDSANANTVTITSDGANEQFRIRRYSNTNEQLIFGFHSSDYGYIQAVEQAVAYRPLSLNPNGGNVGIGTTNPLSELHVVGSARVTGDLIPAVDNTGNVGTTANTWANGQFTSLLVNSTLTVRAAIDLADSDI
jgi:hypothetical protein